MAQLDSAPDSDSGGCRFDSCWVHQKIDKHTLVDFFIQVVRLGISSPHEVRCISSCVSVYEHCDLMIYKAPFW